MVGSSVQRADVGEIAFVVAPDTDVYLDGDVGAVVAVLASAAREADHHNDDMVAVVARAEIDVAVLAVAVAIVAVHQDDSHDDDDAGHEDDVPAVGHDDDVHEDNASVAAGGHEDKNHHDEAVGHEDDVAVAGGHEDEDDVVAVSGDHKEDDDIVFGHKDGDDDGCGEVTMVEWDAWRQGGVGY